MCMGTECWRNSHEEIKGNVERPRIHEIKEREVGTTGTR